MRINHNITSLNTYRQLSTNSANQGKSIEKLSSGLRINRAGDDAAGLAISEKMRGQIRGLDQASRNSQDGISLIQTAEGALNETHSILQRMRELSIQASNETTTLDDRKEIQKEIKQLLSETDRISEQTEFNTKKLLNGDIAVNAAVSGTNTAKIKGANVVDDTLAGGNYSLAVTVGSAVAVANGTDAGTNIEGVSLTGGSLATTDLGQYKLDIADDPANSGRKLATLTNITSGDTWTENNLVVTDDDGNFTIGGFTINRGDAGDGTENLSNGTYTFDVQATFTATLTNDDTSEIVGTKTITNLRDSSFEVGGVNFDVKADLVAGADTDLTIVNNALDFQIGANKGQTTALAISDMSSAALGIDDIDVTTFDGAQSAIDDLDAAIQKVSTERSKLGANQNRLEHTINNLNTSSENLTAAESRIRDVDMAKEMMEQTKNSILSQAAQAMLAQANQQPQGVLQLLR